MMYSCDWLVVRFCGACEVMFITPMMNWWRYNDKRFTDDLSILIVCLCSSGFIPPQAKVGNYPFTTIEV